MGQNRRFPHHAGRLAEERQLREACARGTLHSLSDAQLRLRDQVVSIAPEQPASWGLAWVRFGDTDVRCTVRVKRWTSDAVGVEFEVGEEVMRCWVWQGAVTRLAERNDAWQ